MARQEYRCTDSTGRRDEMTKERGEVFVSSTYLLESIYYDITSTNPPIGQFDDDNRRRKVLLHTTCLSGHIFGNIWSALSIGQLGMMRQ
jgi:hypothetical protein